MQDGLRLGEFRAQLVCAGKPLVSIFVAALFWILAAAGTECSWKEKRVQRDGGHGVKA